ncbi:hypothetical protein WJX74_009376 [Apatococcus lobatus]|uniref:Uncharacterized protein n=2 Tax=Apatococcus TaxID=904362 RepID=A0AAW1TCR3_9CHLO
MQLPDYVQRAIRLGTAVFIAASIGFELISPELGLHLDYPRQWTQACKWAAITCIVINAPVLGKVAQTGVERIIGTLVGGICGYAVFRIGSNFWGPVSDGILLSVAVMLMAGASVIVAHKLSLDSSAKLAALTFCLVTFGSSSVDDAFVLAITRMTGICLGVLLLEACAVIIFPKMATQEALISMQAAMSGLVELNRKAWQQGTGRKEAAEIDLGTPIHPGGYLPLAGEDAGDLKDAEKRMHEKQDQLESDAEKCLMDVYNSLNKCLDYIPQAHSEIYICMVKGKLCMLPGLPWLKIGRWKLPASDMQSLTTSIRKVARILWTTHLTFQEGFDDNMMAMLQQQYPTGLMPELKQRSQDALEDMRAAFPCSAVVKSSNLHTFMNSVEGLFRIGDYQRRRILQYMKKFNRRPSRSARNSISVKVESPEEPSQRSVPGTSAEGPSMDQSTNTSPQAATCQCRNQPAAPRPSPFAAGDNNDERKAAFANSRAMKSTYSMRKPGRRRAPVQDSEEGTPRSISPSSPASFRSDNVMERAASAAHSTQSERPSRPETVYRKFSSMPSSQAPPTVDQYMGRPSIHGRSASMAASEPSPSAHPIALPIDVQETQADNVEQLAESAGGEALPARKSEAAPQDHDAKPAEEGTSRPPTQPRSVQEMYGQHLPRQLWQLPTSRLSIGGHQVAGGGGVRQPLVLLPQQQGSGRQQGLAVLPASFAAQALSRNDKSPRNAPPPSTDESPPRAHQISAHDALKLTASFAGRPSDALQSLPEGLTIHRSGSPRVEPPDDSWSPAIGGQEFESISAEFDGTAQHDQQGCVSIRLPHVASGELIMFPETAEGYVSKVRWYSFQFLMEELAEELEEMHAILSTLLSKLPTANLPSC